MKKRICGLICGLVILVVVVASILFLKPTQPKYIFFFIGDGMGNNEAELTEIVNSYKSGNDINQQELLTFTKFPIVGMRKNSSYQQYITDSAAAATSLASGTITNNNQINIDINNQAVKPITYELHERGYKVGIISTVAINDATPAGFYGSGERQNYDKLTNDLIHSGFEFYAGGNFFKEQLSDEEINQKLLNQGYTVVQNEPFMNKDFNNKTIILTSENEIPVYIHQDKEYNLANYVQKAITSLDNSKGFFIMAESGMIDRCNHNNDFACMMSEVNALNDAVKVAYDFYLKHPKETLIIVTGDHETGGLSLGDYENWFNPASIAVVNETKNDLCNQLNEYNSLQEVIEYLHEKYEDFIPDELVETYFKPQDNNELTDVIMHQLNTLAGINYNTTNHTGERIPVYALGVGSNQLSGVYTNDQFYQKYYKSLIN